VYTSYSADAAPYLAEWLFLVPLMGRRAAYPGGQFSASHLLQRAREGALFAFLSFLLEQLGKAEDDLSSKSKMACMQCSIWEWEWGYRVYQALTD